MKSPARLATIAAGALALALTAGTAVAQQKSSGNCTPKAGQGTNSTVDGAKFQAWEAVLQAYDWSVWGAMMASKQAVGHAPGVQVRNLQSRCKPDGLGQVCVVQALLCR
jgi:hypothetical protein